MNKKNRNKWVQIVAFFALFWIIIWIIGTWVLIIVESVNRNKDLEYEIINNYNESNQSWSVINDSAINTNIDTNTWTWVIVWTWSLD